MSWKPTTNSNQKTNIGKLILKHGFASYNELWQWSVANKEAFWEQTVLNLGIVQHKNYTEILNTDEGVENAKWLYNAELNIVDSCFQNDDDANAIVFQKPNEPLQKITQKELLAYVNKVANSFAPFDVNPDDTIAIDLPMTLESVVIYLAAIKAGIKVATIADSFSVNEIASRLQITKPKLVFTQDYLLRKKEALPLYQKVVEAGAKKVVVLPSYSKKELSIRQEDIFWDDFLSNNPLFNSVKQSAQNTITILFSSGTTGEPKAIPWNHTTPIKSASDGYYHHNIQKNDVVCWPTNMGWMMGPWLVFAALINKACIALYYDAPLSSNFGAFVQKAKVTMLGVIPSIVKHWKLTKCMENLDWSAIKCFSSTGEVSNPLEMNYLMQLANNKPIIEYCGGTEIGGGYIASSLVQENIPSTFSTKALGSDFVILDNTYKQAKKGEVFLIPPAMGLSTKLLNKNHHSVYYKDAPHFPKKLRRHGDEIAQLDNGYFKAMGRVDDAMNLGGIKVSATQIEEVVNQLGFVKESCAVAITPKDGGPSQLVIFYVETVANNSSQLLEQTRRIVKEKLNPLFKVADLVKINRLPRTASNKVMRRSLRDGYSL